MREIVITAVAAAIAQHMRHATGADRGGQALIGDLEAAARALRGLHGGRGLTDGGCLDS